MDSFGVKVPKWMYAAGGGHVNPMAGLVMLILCAIVCMGVQSTTKLNALIVGATLAVLLFIIGLGS